MSLEGLDNLGRVAIQFVDDVHHVVRGQLAVVGWGWDTAGAAWSALASGRTRGPPALISLIRYKASIGATCS